ncbi:hypothetical protein L227DRAFT_296555 [Lentinus tigrinus ALCF2SS1-6]|uniref:Uncharacterized protein n=1 Tax=Lentinus tigrinus ALCF2SS1-6 TaxID=1328759 RepID=A0A5C2RY38_9APHY|nr:hypothetical protein L227DRAFT_296555 [Lentinus tigrinus ALCF2SS1-6]
MYSSCIRHTAGSRCKPSTWFFEAPSGHRLPVDTSSRHIWVGRNCRISNCRACGQNTGLVVSDALVLLCGTDGRSKLGIKISIEPRLNFVCVLHWARFGPLLAHPYRCSSLSRCGSQKPATLARSRCDRDCRKSGKQLDSRTHCRRASYHYSRRYWRSTCIHATMTRNG